MDKTSEALSFLVQQKKLIKKNKTCGSLLYNNFYYLDFFKIKICKSGIDAISVRLVQPSTEPMYIKYCHEYG